MSGMIVVAGSIAQRAGKGGSTWVRLQYLLGLKRLGWDVLLLDRLEPAMCVDASGRACPLEASVNLAYLERVMRDFGLADAWALLYDHGGRCLGLPRELVIEQTKRAAMLIDIMGFVTDEEILRAAPRRVFLDLDPGFGQMWKRLALADVFRGYDDFVTIGENIGQPGCAIPTCGLPWVTTPQPVVLDAWPVAPETPEGRFTSIATWRGAYGPIDYAGGRYGLRVHEFRKFVEIPRRTRQRFELALDIHPSETQDLALCASNGWSLTDPMRAAGDPQAYQAYIQRSKAEFGVAKHMYTHARSGWFSDRTLCYLASGKPALIQDTGWQDRYPAGEGLLAFTTLEEAVRGVEAIAGDYPRHCRAARTVAQRHFDSDQVLSRLLERLGVNCPVA